MRSSKPKIVGANRFFPSRRRSSNPIYPEAIWAFFYIYVVAAAKKLQIAFFCLDLGQEILKLLYHVLYPLATMFQFSSCRSNIISIMLLHKGQTQCKNTTFFAKEKRSNCNSWAIMTIFIIIALWKVVLFECIFSLSSGWSDTDADY